MASVTCRVVHSAAVLDEYQHGDFLGASTECVW